MKLEIITPEKLYYTGEVSIVNLPGIQGHFTLLENHAPIISSLTKGKVSYRDENGLFEFYIENGVVESKQNHVTVCTELMQHQ